MSPLQGATVLVTRPAHQAEGLCRRIEERGGHALRLPALEILPPSDPAALAAVLRRLDGFDLAIFISINAVERGLEALADHGGLPAGLRLAAVGKSSARALAERGHPPELCPPPPYNSESLLAMAPLQAVAGLRIVIFRGEGGRDLLGDTLRERGAEVEYAQCYRRARPAIDPTPLVQRLNEGTIAALTATSNESLDNLHALLVDGAREALLATPLAVVSERTRERARELGFHGPIAVAEEAGDEAFTAAIEQCLSNRCHRNR